MFRERSSVIKNSIANIEQTKDKITGAKLEKEPETFYVPIK